MPLPEGWQAAPWCEPLRAAAGRLPPQGSMAERLNASGWAPRRFVPQAALPEGEAYEAFIHRSGQVPTRDNLHDAFNGLMPSRRASMRCRRRPSRPKGCRLAADRCATL